MVSDRVLRAGTADIAQAAADQLAGLLTASTNAARVATQIQALHGPLIEIYGNAAAAFAAEWYEALRSSEAIPGRFRAKLADLPTASRAEALARWAVTPMATDPEQFASVLGQAQAGLSRDVTNMSRHTITGSSIEDPKSRGWQRVGSGHSCPFCLMLISRGAVYSSASAPFAAHDNCTCSARPAWEDKPLPVEPFKPSMRTASDADKARLRAYLRENGEDMREAARAGLL